MKWLANKEDEKMKLATIKELFKFLMKQKKWWLMPIVAIFVLMGLLFIFAETSATAPFIYTLF